MLEFGGQRLSARYFGEMVGLGSKANDREVKLP
jgi:hypothetical protein